MDEAAKIEDVKLDSQYELSVSEDKLSVMISCKFEMADEQDQLFIDIRAELEKMGIKGNFHVKYLISALQKAKNNSLDITDLVIVKGNPSVMPKDGKLEWSKDFFAEGYQIDHKTDTIDFRQKAALLNITKGESLVKVHPEIPGENGCDVYGKLIRPPSPKKITLRGGPNVVWNENKKEYQARCSGRLNFKGSTLDVMDIYTIQGNVGSETGNIEHNGEVKIKGDVISNFKVEAEGNIEIKGLVGDCDIDCGGDLVIRGGINSTCEKLIKVVGDANIKYSDNAVIECKGNVNVDVEIHHCRIYSSGKITCRGIIVGGKTVSAKGISVAEAGSKSNTITTLIAGIDFQLLKALKLNSDEKENSKKKLKKLKIEQTNIENLGSHLKSEQKEALTEIQFHIMETEEETAEQEIEDKKLFDLINTNRSAQIEILDVVYQGTILKIIDSQYQIEETMKGPIIARFDNETNKIKLFNNTNQNME